MLVVDRDVVASCSVAGSTASPADLVLLRRERERVLERLLDGHRLAVELEAADRVPVLEQLLVVELEVVEVLPPLRLLLAAVVVEELREQPARLALLRAGEQPVADARALGVALLRLLAPLALRPAAGATAARAGRCSSSQRCSS